MRKLGRAVLNPVDLQEDRICPPHALSIRPGSPAKAFAAALKAAHVLAHANLVGTYKRG